MAVGVFVASRLFSDGFLHCELRKLFRCFYEFDGRLVGRDFRLNGPIAGLKSNVHYVKLGR